VNAAPLIVLIVLRFGGTTAIDYRDIISMEPAKRGCQPFIRGMCITVYDVLSYIAADMTELEIPDDFPELTHTDILICLS
jgi:uncharacterized protein (DUF433 family)